MKLNNNSAPQVVEVPGAPGSTSDFVRRQGARVLVPSQSAHGKDTEEVSVFDVSERNVAVLYDRTERVLILHVPVQPDEVIHVVHVHVSSVVPAYQNLHRNR